MSHGNATLSPLGRLKLARFHVQSGSSIRASAERFQVSTTTALRWSGRYRQVLAAGRQPRVADMEDRSSRPHRSPAHTHVRVERRIRHLRLTRRPGPMQIAGRVGVPASTVHRVLVRSGLNRLDHMDRATGEVIRRYERDNPGDLIHFDIKKFALIPPGGGWKVHGQEAAGPGCSGRERRNRRVASSRGSGRAGYAYVHSAVDDRSRLAYSGGHDDESFATTIAFWHRAAAFYVSHGITVREVITDNGVAYRAHAWKNTLTAAGITVR